MKELSRTIISQYDDSPRINAVIEKLNQVIDPRGLIDDFYNLIWNIETAEKYGLDVWGRIVGVNRVLQLQAAPYWGFNEATTLSASPWNQAPYYSGQQLTSNYALTDDAYRQLIYAKALANLTDGSIPSINLILRTLFGTQGNTYVQDNLDMTMTYVFDFVLNPVEVAIVTQSGVLPRSTGVECLFIENGTVIGTSATPIVSVGEGSATA